jgi:hypothetical protein
MIVSSYISTYFYLQRLFTIPSQIEIKEEARTCIYRQNAHVSPLSHLSYEYLVQKRDAVLRKSEIKP